MNTDKIISTVQKASIYGDDSIISISDDTAKLVINESISSVVIISDNALGNSEYEEFLYKILAACRITNDAIYITSGHHRWKDLKIAYPSLLNVFLFGMPIDTLGLPLRNNPYQVINFDNVRIICAEPLEKISVDNNAKSFLWREILQPTFNK